MSILKKDTICEMNSGSFVPYFKCAQSKNLSINGRTLGVEWLLTQT
jgi:hypothetical protein